VSPSLLSDPAKKFESVDDGMIKHMFDTDSPGIPVGESRIAKEHQP
jgi:hypothetical protein